eukprot:5826669-Pleurochrysis_carterae.AAC.1
MWTGRKNEHKVNVQRRWDNRNTMSKLFKRWKLTTGFDNKDNKEETEGDKGSEERKEKTHGMKHWGRYRAIPSIHITVKKNYGQG